MTSNGDTIYIGGGPRFAGYSYSVVFKWTIGETAMRPLANTNSRHIRNPFQYLNYLFFNFNRLNQWLIIFLAG